jgi:hypothetical protein
MKLDEFEKMLNSAIGYLDKYITARAIRDLGYNLHFYNETWGHNNTDDQPVKWRGLLGLEDTKIYLTVFDGIVNPNITRADLLRLYKPFLKELHKIAINARYGLNSCMPATALDANTYIMEDTDMTYTLLNEENSRGGTNWLIMVEPKKIHFNGPATIVEWNDGTKTVVKCQKGDTFDPMTGVAMACMKKMLGTNASGSNYLNDISKLIDEAWEVKNKRFKKKNEALKPKKEPTWNEIAKKMEQKIAEQNIEEAIKNRYSQTAEDDIDG